MSEMMFCLKIGLVATILAISRVACVQDNDLSPYLLWTDRRHINSLQIDTGLKETVLENLKNVIALDFDYQDGFLFWSDMIDKQIFRARKTIDGPVVDEMVIVSDDIKTPEGIAVDWIHNHMYWVDSSADQIEVATYDGKMRKTLVTQGLDKPRAIAVDPFQGWMFWTDWGTKPMISRCGLNGKHQSVIVDDGLGWPNGLTFDYVDQRLFWIDAKLDQIRSVDTDGGSGYTVLRNDESLSHPFAITLFEDELYWTDWKSHSINKVTKRGDRSQRVYGDLQMPFGIRMYHADAQKNGSNRCGTNNGRCSGFCFPSPQGDGVPNDTDKSNGFTCGCPNLYRLDSDQKTCVPETADLSPYLLWTDRRHIHSLQLGTGLAETLLWNRTDVVALDFEYHDGFLFWGDVIDKQIFRGRKTVDGPVVDEVVIVSGDIKTPEGIAVDWLHNHVYWVDSGADQIEVATYDGKMRKTLVTKGLVLPRAIAVDPFQGWMFWTDWGTRPRISRCGLNGKHQSVIVDEGLGWPNDLTFDYVDQRLFWIDAKLDQIRSVDTDGGSGYTVLRGVESLLLPYAITLFEDDLYWTDAMTSSKVKKISGYGYQQVFVGHRMPYGIHVYHVNKQKNGTNRCGTNNGRCSGFCFPSPQGDGVPNDTDKINGFTCGCSNLYRLDSDQKTCVPETVGKGNLLI